MPELGYVQNLYQSYWNDLSPERPVGFAEGYIPRDTIRKYGADELGLEGDDLEFFFQVIRKTDRGYLSGEALPRGTQDVVAVTDTTGVKSLLARLAAPKGGRDRFNKRAKARPNARKRHRPDDNNPA